MKKHLFVAALSLFAAPAYAVEIGFEAAATFDYTATAFALDGSSVAPTVPDSGSISAFSSGSRDVLNTFESIGESDSLTLTNTSASDILVIDWVLSTFVEAFADIQPDRVVDPTFVEVTSFAGVMGDVSGGSFTFAMGSYECSAADLADPGISCDGFAQGGSDSSFNSGFIELAPGDSFFVSVETAPLLIVTTDIAAVPLPAGGALLLSGLLGFRAFKRSRRLAQ